MFFFGSGVAETTLFNLGTIVGVEGLGFFSGVAKIADFFCF